MIKYNVSQLDLYSLYSSNENFMLDLDNMSFLTYKSLAEDIIKAYKTLSKIESKKVLLYAEDKYIFFVFILAVSFTDKNVYIPNNNKALYIKDISDKDMTYISDLEKGFYDKYELNCNTLYISEILNVDIKDQLEKSILKEMKQNSDMRVSFYTSGSTGTPKIVEKVLKFLAIEIIYLGRELYEKSKDSILMTTASQCHLYGFTFTLLLPFSLGILFARNKINYAETFNKLKDYKKITFITTPSFLKRIEKDSIKIKPQWNLVAGTELLEIQLFNYVKEIFGVRMMDFYGSTETGVIANRYIDESSFFKVFDGVNIKLNEDEELMVSSPYSDNKYVCIGDVAEIKDNIYFTLLGRKDDLTKIEGKRLNINTINAKMLEHDLFKDCQSITNNINNRNVVVSFLVPKDKKTMTIPFRERKSIVIDYLSHYFDKTILPKKVIFMDTIPVNINLKVDRVKLKYLSDKHIIDKKYDYNYTVCSEKYLEVLLHFPEDSIYFEGHFETMKILPSVAQMQIVYDIFKNYYDSSLTVKNIKRMKFLNMITPNMKVILSLTLDKDKLVFEYSHNGKIYSSGAVLLG